MLISIIAAPPPNTVSIAKAEDELALQLIRKALEARQGEDHHIRSAASLGDIVDHLEALAPKAGDHVQLIGHGTPGMLALGYFWTGEYHTDSDTYALDSDLSSHQVLDGLVHPEASVSLIGCAVGEDRVGVALCDGPTLVFDLARLWSCSVSASVGPVGVDDFDSAGAFLKVSPSTKAHRVVTARDRSVSAVSPRSAAGGQPRTLPKMVAIAEMRVLGPHRTPDRIAKVSSQLTAMPQIAAQEIPDQCVLGLPEIVATLEDGSVATFLSNASIIRVSSPDTPDRPAYYAPVAAPELQEHVRRAVRSAF